jgi:hypothetical protein
VALIVDDDFIFIFLVFYRKFAAPSKLLQSLIAKFKEATESAIDYMLQMIPQMRYAPSIDLTNRADVAIL